MNKTAIGYLVISTLLIVLGSSTLFAFLSKGENTQNTTQKSDKINLALRQTAHLLLKQAGDSTSRIAPVKKIQDNYRFACIEYRVLDI